MRTVRPVDRLQQGSAHSRTAPHLLLPLLPPLPGRGCNPGPRAARDLSKPTCRSRARAACCAWIALLTLHDDGQYCHREKARCAQWRASAWSAESARTSADLELGRSYFLEQTGDRREY